MRKLVCALSAAVVLCSAGCAAPSAPEEEVGTRESGVTGEAALVNQIEELVDEIRKLEPKLVSQMNEARSAIDSMNGKRWLAEEALRRMRDTQTLANAGSCQALRVLDDDYLQAGGRMNAALRAVHETGELINTKRALALTLAAKLATRSSVLAYYLRINYAVKKVAAAASVAGKLAPVVGWAFFAKDAWAIGSEFGDLGLLGSVAQAAEHNEGHYKGGPLDDDICYDKIGQARALELHLIETYGVNLQASSRRSAAIMSQKLMEFAALKSWADACEEGHLGPFNEEWTYPDLPLTADEAEQQGLCGGGGDEDY